jgi:hypothetical protein
MRLMLFRAGPYRLALALATIREIHPAEDLRIAGEGRCVLAGREMAFRDLGFRPDGRGPEAGHPRAIRIEAGGRSMALLADAVERVIGVTEDRIVPLPSAFRGRSARWFPAVVRSGETLALLLSPEGLAGIVSPDSPAPGIADPEPMGAEAAAFAVLAARTLTPDRMVGILSRGLERTLPAALERHLRSLPARLFAAGVR